MKALFLCVLTGLATTLWAADGRECEGIDFPDQMQSDGGTLKLNGLGLRQATFLKVNVYIAALYVPQPTSDGNAILDSNASKTLILHFVRDVDQSDLNKGWDEGFEHNAKGQLPVLRERIEAFKGLMTDIKSGWRLRFVYKTGQGIAVDVDDKIMGKIKGDDFARALFSIWLGSHPPNKGLKDGLLGGGCG